MKPAGGIYDFILREWLLLVAAAGFTLTSVYAGHLPAVSGAEIEILVLLLALFMVVKGWEGSSFLDYLAATLERGGQAALRLVIATFLLSMFVTNDAALVVMVPLALALDIRRQDLLVILLALAANAGSALTPVGNPQNLFIYWYYGIAPGRFMAAIAPFTVVFLVLLSLAALLVPAVRSAAVRRDRIKVDRTAYAYGILLVVVLLAVLRVLPAWSALMVVPYGLLFDRRSLRIDFALLLTLALFFGLADNLKSLFIDDMNSSEASWMVIANSNERLENIIGRQVVPVGISCIKMTRFQSILIADSHGRGRRIDINNVHWFTQSHSQSSSLTDSEMYDAIVLAKNFACCIYNITLSEHLRPPLTKQAGIITLHETYLLTIRRMQRG